MLLETAGWRVFWGLTSERQTKSAAEMTVATCSNLGFKKPLSLSPDALHHTHFNSKGLKREVADAWTCFCAKFVVPLQRGEMRWVVFPMVNGLDLLRHAKTQFEFSELLEDAKQKTRGQCSILKELASYSTTAFGLCYTDLNMSATSRQLDTKRSTI